MGLVQISRRRLNRLWIDHDSEELVLEFLRPYQIRRIKFQSKRRMGIMLKENLEFKQKKE